MANVIIKRTAVELEHPDTGKICLANCICCAKSRLLEKGLFEDTPVTYICTDVNWYKNQNVKKSELPILADLNYCCHKFELCQDFIRLGYRVVGKYGIKIAEDKKIAK